MKVSIICDGCKKPFEFDAVATKHTLKSFRASATGGVTLECYPVCPHCDKSNTTIVRTDADRK